MLGAVVVLKRVRPGLRLLCTAWSFILGQTVLYAVQAYQTISLGREQAFKNPDEAVFPIDETPVVAYIATDLVVILISVVGLLLALNARRPNH